MSGALAHVWFAGEGVGGYVFTMTFTSICVDPATLNTCVPSRFRAKTGGVSPTRHRSSFVHTDERMLTTGLPVPNSVDAKIRTSRGSVRVNEYVSSPVLA